jgi:hypothetical protein
MTSHAAGERVAFLSIGCPIHTRPVKPAARRERAMQAHWRQQPDDRKVQAMTEDELDREMRLGMDDWCDLLDDLLSTGGMLPSRDLAGRVVSFFEDEYWRAEDARIETLRRQMVDHSRRRCGAVHVTMLTTRVNVELEGY